MKRIRRISVEIEHREITFSLGRTHDNAAAPVSESLQAKLAEIVPAIAGGQEVPATCPVCGADWVFAMVEVGSSASVATLQGAFAQFGLHLHVSPSGELRICSKSFEEIKEKL